MDRFNAWVENYDHLTQGATDRETDINRIAFRLRLALGPNARREFLEAARAVGYLDNGELARGTKAEAPAPIGDANTGEPRA